MIARFDVLVAPTRVMPIARRDRHESSFAPHTRLGIVGADSQPFSETGAVSCFRARETPGQQIIGHYRETWRGVDEGLLT